ncbi:wall-associated receptor kinase 17-like isoform X2 [Phragmites australis]|uniref:wall-associated receptor kinase 17-like isoform X2 n=1 Tax=Phragmites australis TaxID=29695 RepID=UPI002D7814C9|nr:wall-associated receptor kinase 17-like isoform X2 [Phragmites australis]
MSIGRESRSGAAVAAGDAVARPLALALALFSAMPRDSLSQGLALPPPLPPNMTCDGVPYPFGVRNKSLSGFEVICGPNKEAMLPIGEHRYKINFVSPESYVVIFAGPIWQVCYDRNGKPTPTTGTGPMNLEGTPFTFSKSNKLVNIGCNYEIVANFTNPPGDFSPWPYASCTTSCYGSSNAIINGSCSGEACCQIDIPGPVNGAQAFTLTFNRTMENVSSKEYGTCSAAFFLRKDEQVFDGSNEGKRPLKEALLPPGERRMILDWAIGRATCDQAQSYTVESPCNDMSACVDAPSGAGYLCKCHEGYEGNPYVRDGCEGPPTQQPQGLGVCSNPEKNPCTYIKYCIAVQGEGIASCACPQGMSGDGRKMGSGCQKPFPLVTVLGAGLALVVTMTTAVSCYCWAMKKGKVERKRAELFRKNGGLLLQQKFSAITSQQEGLSAKIFGAEELKTATDNYSESRILGRGGHGIVYKGILPDKTVVAIKKSKVFDESQVEQFVNEITILSQIDHQNVVKLLGCCLETPVPLLVYEFIPNGTLFQYIHNRNVPHPLTWEDSLRIAAEIAEALAYLHSTSSIPIIHRDIKSSNILLDENFVAKISDFGASRSVPFDQTHVTTLIQGTIGYLDPEYFQSSQLTEKSDVYSFGVVLAELLTRQKPISVARPEESRNLAMYLVILFNEARLLQETEPHILAEAGEEQLYAIAELSVRCLNLKGEERPAMKEVASVLDGLRRSFTMEQTIRRNDESVHKNNEQVEDHLIHETRPISNQNSSEISAQCSMEAEILSSSHMPR